ncbi:MAG: hypothetical protein R2715_18455 [Ilumatobacteraceae bacterium]
MIRLLWNSLRLGDEVLVHVDEDRDEPLIAGRVTMIQTARGSNDVAIRLSPPDGPSTVVHPKRLAVHLGELDPTEDCWRCATRAIAQAKNSPRLSPLPAAN